MGKKENSLIKFDVNIAGDESTNKLIERISGATGIVLGVYKEKQKAKTNFLSEINNRQDLSAIEKLAIISNYKKVLKEYENQNDIVSKALDLLKKPINECDTDSIEDTWLMNFMDNSKNVCDEELKIIWSKILAGEIENPGKYSLRTLEEVKKINKKDAELFTKLANFVMKAENKYFILRDDNLLSKYGITYENIISLDEVGFIKDDGKNLNYVGNESQIIYNNLIVFIRSKKDKLSLNIYKLTEVGEEVFSLLQNASANSEFLKEYAKNRNNLEISYSEIINMNSNTIMYNSNITKLYDENK